MSRERDVKLTNAGFTTSSPAILMPPGNWIESCVKIVPRPPTTRPPHQSLCVNSLSPNRLVLWIAFAIVGVIAVADDSASNRSESQLRFFESRIRPLLIDRCYECHADQRSEGGLRLDVAEAIQLGGDNGPVIEPGEPEASLLVAAIRYRELEMPPDEPLSSRSRKTLKRGFDKVPYGLSTKRFHRKKKTSLGGRHNRLVIYPFRNASTV